MIPFEARARTYLNSLPDDHPERPLVQAHVDLIKAHNEALQAASKPTQVVVYREEVSRHADLAATLNPAGGYLNDDIPLNELRSSDGWKHGVFDQEIAPWVKIYKSLPKGSKTAVTTMVSAVSKIEGIDTLGQFRSADWEQLPKVRARGRGEVKEVVSRQMFDFAQAVFARPLGEATPAAQEPQG